MRLKKSIYTSFLVKMIDYIKGELAELQPALCVVEASGVGYALNISLNTYEALRSRQQGGSGPAVAKLFVHEAIVTGGRDDSITLYGFAGREERELYRLLITVSGVGANTARMILSSLSPSELAGVIAQGDERVLKSVKGIGLKTAQRIIVDLKDKVAALGLQPDGARAYAQQAGAPVSETHHEAVAALTMLGFSPAPSAKVVGAILKEQPLLPVEQVVKMALKMIK